MLRSGLGTLRVGGVALSPDAKYVAYTEARWQDSSGDRKSDLWLIDAKTAKAKKGETKK